MSKTGKAIFTVSGATNIPLFSGEVLLIGRPDVFGSDFRPMIEQDRPGFTERVIRNINTYASHGAGRLHEVLADIDGWGNGPLSARGIMDRVAALVRRGSLLALILPPVAANDIATDGRQLGEMSGDLPDANQVNPEISIEGVSFAELKSFQDKLVYVVRKSADYFSTDSLKEAFENAMTATVIISTVVVLAFWAASHFAAGAGFAIDAILLAIGWVMIGWGIFSALRSLLACLKSVKDANSIEDLNKAAEQFADALTQVGVDLLIGLLTRGAGKLRAKSSSKPDGGGSGSGSGSGSAGGAGGKSKADIEADNKAKAAAAKTASAKSAAGFKDDVHPGLHNRSDVEVPYKDYDWAKWKTRREIKMDNLSPQDKLVKDEMKLQGRSEREVAEVLSSSTGVNPKVIPIEKGDKLYGFQSQGIAKPTDNKYWLDEKAYKDVESKYFKDGAWDKEGVKNYLALPCVNAANSLVTAEAQKAGSAIETTIGRASEELPIIIGGTGRVDNIAKIMPGGGTQITPDTDLLKIISHTGS